MFNTNHYIPILKWKRAEQGALKTLAEKNKEHITPLVQFVMPKYKPQEDLGAIIERFEDQSLQIPARVVEIWGRTPIFIDVSLLFTTPLKVKALGDITRGGHELGGIFVPVIHLNDDQEIQKVAYSLAKENKTGLCVRLICSDFADQDKLKQEIEGLLSSSGLSEKDIDLLIDIKETEKNGDKYSKYLSLSQNIPNLLKWRSYIFAGGSFPEDLSECKIDAENLISRIEWDSWRENVESNKLKRNPSFSDYTIQHPIYKETSQLFHPTSSIKYALDKDWLIMKGKKQKFDLYLASAATLVKDKRFRGESFSDGDKYIAEKAKHFEAYIKKPAIKGTGSTETWLRAGINHHLTLVAHQISNLLSK